MKKLRITFNGKVYEVQVEVLEDDETHYPGAPAAAPSWMPPARTSSDPPPPVKPPKAPSPPDGPGTPVVHAPIVGTVRKILVRPGDKIEENTPLIVLDAMKMDTYVNAPHAGTVGTVHCEVGDSVHAGQELVTYA